MEKVKMLNMLIDMFLQPKQACKTSKIKKDFMSNNEFSANQDFQSIGNQVVNINIYNYYDRNVAANESQFHSVSEKQVKD